jgi:hypothetical protein
MDFTYIVTNNFLSNLLPLHRLQILLVSKNIPGVTRRKFNFDNLLIRFPFCNLQRRKIFESVLIVLFLDKLCCKICKWTVNMTFLLDYQLSVEVFMRLEVITIGINVRVLMAKA